MKCVICLVPSRDHQIRTKSDSSSSSSALAMLEDQLTVIYFLDKFLRYPLLRRDVGQGEGDDLLLLEDLLGSTGKNPSELVGFCERCRAVVEQGKELYRDAEKIQKELEELRGIIEERVVDSFEKDPEGDGDDLLVKKLRETIYRKSSRRRKDLNNVIISESSVTAAAAAVNNEDSFLQVKVERVDYIEYNENEAFLEVPESIMTLEKTEDYNYNDKEVDEFAIEPEDDDEDEDTPRLLRSEGGDKRRKRISTGKLLYPQFKIGSGTLDNDGDFQIVNPLEVEEEGNQDDKDDDEEFTISNGEGSNEESDDDYDEDWRSNRKPRNSSPIRKTINRCWKEGEESNKIPPYESKRTTRKNKIVCHTCPVCFKVYPRSDRLRRHIIVKHEKPTDHSCETCNKNFLTDEALKTHQLTHTEGNDGNKLENKLNHKETGLSDNLEDETDQFPDTKKKKKNKVCPVCSKAFRRMDRLKNHINAQHEKAIVYSCETCGKSFYTPETLRCHKRNHMSKAELMELEEAEKRKWRTCHVCKEVFETTSERKIHFKKAHPPEKNERIQCEKCGQYFPKNAPKYFEEHMEWHETGVYTGKFKCSFCDKTFPRKIQYENHLVTHTGEKRFLCSHCGKAFSLKHALDKHILVTHSENPPQIVCSICGKVFKTKWYLTQHMQSISHGGPGFPKSNRSKQRNNIMAATTSDTYDSNNDSSSRNDS